MSPRRLFVLNFDQEVTGSVFFDLLQNGFRSYVAFDILGQRPAWLLIGALLLWLAVLVLYESDGRMRILGFVTIGGAVGVEIYNYSLNYLGTNARRRIRHPKDRAPFSVGVVIARKQMTSRALICILD